MKLSVSCLALAATLAWGEEASAQERILTRAIEVRSLSFDEARAGREAKLRGTVTFIEGSSAVFIQDETAGTFFRPEKVDTLRPGDVVEVTGRTQPGVYLPGLALSPYRILGHGPLPAPILASYDDLASGRYHYQRVAIEGIVRSVENVGEGRSVLRVDVGSRIVESMVDARMEDESALVDSRVRVEGLAAGAINQRRQLVQPHLRSRDGREIKILEPAVPETSVPLVAGSDLLTFRVEGQGNHRLRVEGVVTASLFRRLVFVRSGRTAFGLQFFSPATVEVGDRIAALGFVEMGRFSATVVDAKLFQREAGPPPDPVPIDIPSALDGTRDGDLVAVTAVLTEFFRSDNGVVLAMQSKGQALQARGPAMNLDLPLGSLVRVTGICQVESSTRGTQNSKPVSVGLLIRSREDIAVLRSPSWWTAQRLVTLLLALTGVTLIAFLWIAILRRQVRQQTEVLRRRIEAEAALEERQRIAREFHDSLEQDLTGLGLRLDAAATRALDEKGRSIIAVARSLLSRIQAETKIFVSDLRDAGELDSDLVAALEAVAAMHDAEIDIRVEFTAAPPPLAAGSVHHLRMIARESVTNAIKHAHATQIVIHVAVHDDQLMLRVSDNGCGFDVAAQTLGKSGHFGCVGIRERARKLRALVTWRSVPGIGTTVEVTFPLAREREAIPSVASGGASPEPARTGR